MTVTTRRLLILVLLLGGCSTRASEPVAASSGAGGRDSEPVMMSPDHPGVPVERARELLAQRLGIDPQTIEVLEAREVTWRNSSLGCPRPGMMYTQQLVNGARILLRAQGRIWHYHAGGSGEPFYCDNPQSPAAGPGDR